jgi:hypothetical protein
MQLNQDTPHLLDPDLPPFMDPETLMLLDPESPAVLDPEILAYPYAQPPDLREDGHQARL